MLLSILPLLPAFGFDFGLGFPAPYPAESNGQVLILNEISLRQKLREATHPRIHLRLQDRHYTALQVEWVDDAMAWLTQFTEKIGLDLHQVRQDGFHNDNYARLLITMADSKSALNAQHHYNFGIGFIDMKLVNAWGQEPATGERHTYLLFLTDDGLIVYDAVHRDKIHLAQHPNREHTVAVYF